MSFSRHVGVSSLHSSRFRWRWLAGFGTAVSLLSVSVSFAGTMPQPPVATVTETPVAAFEYTRELSGVNGEIEALQVAVRRFEPVSGSGPTISLVSAIHLGEKDYYTQLQRFLDKQDIVLYEGVKPPRKMMTSAMVSVATQYTISVAVSIATSVSISIMTPLTGRAETSKVSIEMGLQKAMAEALNLQSQDEGINYLRPNFRNSDLSWDQLEELAAKSGEGTSKSLEKLGAVLDGSVPSDTANMFNAMLEEAMANPTMFRRRIVESIYSPDIMSSTDPKMQDQKNLDRIVVAERNKTVLADLKAITDKKARSVRTIAIFYGADHMQDMEQHLVADMGYRPVGTKWLTAITVGPEAPASSASTARRNGS